MARQDRAARGEYEHALLLEHADLVDADAQRLLLRPRARPFPPRAPGSPPRSLRAGAGASRGSPTGETPSLTSRPMRRSSEETAANCARSFSISCRRDEVAGVDLGDLALDVGGVLGEAGLLDPGDLLAVRDRLALFGHPRGQPALARKRQREALLLRDGEEAHGLPRRSRAERAPRNPTPRPARYPPPGTPRALFSPTLKLNTPKGPEVRSRSTRSRRPPRRFPKRPGPRLPSPESRSGLISTVKAPRAAAS